ncbi:tRNA (guanosine(46)-N7)-methyltransferase TrmB [Pelagicoccus sp. SDUM812003]|uniref:tRNA (guanosine(46)-N7)-methyltransferase TrmB n=1 Tax=Pelagicoccus sp. SDUM812003 TaxID=3041267 RepID=UPI00280D3E59|nr:tRNA (guanosine(46)-N7)-methyltransferase TrmB [Pelagicoccus sp. SDUM812003]MDQ8204235.1 tRNA (guanosine(46)-N7)-methyltransferase TrmB [Pelagicoccus sp. SDUM812003]
MPSGYEQHLDWVAQRRRSLKERLAKRFAEPVSLTLEIGCGHGHWLVDYAAAFPDKTCLGIDIIGDRIERAERKRQRAGQGNLSFVRGEAFETLDLMPPQVTLAEVFILFPDPWPKKRHWKKRLFSLPFLDELAKRSDPGVLCHFRTDHDPYFDWALELLPEQQAWEREEGREWPFERETVFQARAPSYQSLILRRV